MVNEIDAVDNLRLENQLTKLTSLVRQLAVGQHQPSIAARVCGICTSMEHPTDMCSTLQETESNHLESVGAIGGYQYGKQSYQIKDHLPLNDLDLSRMSLKLKLVIGRQVHNTKRHLSNNYNNREYNLKVTHNFWKT
ncbi:hypothetical protein CR513_22765, partial [Mucuna pruriens]